MSTSVPRSPLQHMACMQNQSLRQLAAFESHVKSWLCPSAQTAALNAIEVERRVRKEEYDRRRARLRAHLASDV